jgi:chromosome condensin MukBEF complex kleisin-like MukF subunit
MKKLRLFEIEPWAFPSAWQHCPSREGSMDIIGVTGLIVALIALWVALYGIRDVRKLVRELVTMERNRAFTQVLHRLVWQFVDPTDKALGAEIAQKMQEFTMLARAVDEDLTLDAAQEQANHEALTYAEMLVDVGYASWKTDMDPDRARELLEKWQANQNAARVAKMLGKQKLFLF